MYRLLTYRDPMPRSRWIFGLIGLLSAAFGVAVGEFVAALRDAAYAPIQVVSSSAIDLPPAPVKEWATATFGTSSKSVVVGVVVAAVVIIAIAAGIFARRRLTVGVLMCLGVGALGALAGLRRPTDDWFAPVPSIIAGVVAALALTLLVRTLRPRDSEYAVKGSTRRTFLLQSGAMIALGAGALAGARALASSASATASRLATKLPLAIAPLPPLPASVTAPVTGMQPFITPNVNFYRIDTAVVVPQVEATTWSLKFSGMVRRPFTITYDDLLEMPMVERDITLMCVSNPVGGNYIGNARWLGTPLVPLLERAGIDPSADQLFSTSVDGWTCSTPLADLADRDPILAIGMNGEPLPIDHGFPVRMVIPGLYGFISATKWVTNIEASTYAQMPAYWSVRGWATSAPVLTGSRIDQPNSVARPGKQAIAGVAWAMDGDGISKVEINVDDGPWLAANLADVPGPTTWRQWWLPYDLTPGTHAITVRATNGRGELQTPDLMDVIPSGATGYDNRIVNCV